MNSSTSLFSLLKKQKGSIILLFVLANLFVVAQLAQPFLLGKALDAARNNNQSLYIALLAVALILIVIGVISGYFFEAIASNMSQRMVKDLREEIYQKIIHMSIEDFDKRHLGDMLQLEIRDMENMFTASFSIFKTLLQGLFSIVVTIIMMLLVNWILALMVMLLTPLSILVARFVSSFNHKHFKKQAALQAEINDLTLESINHMDVINAFNYEEVMADRFNKTNEKLQKEGIIAQFSASWVNPSTRLVNNTIYALVGITGIIMMAYDTALAGVYAVMSLGALSSFLSYTTQYGKPFNEVSNVVAEFEVGRSSFKRINDFLNLKDDIDEGTKEIKEINNIRFEHVYFSYDKSRSLIEDFSITISKGEKIAIVGPTGAGKTTLINLLMRFYDVDKGAIYINDIDIREIKKSSLRASMGMVLQDTWIFNGTIKDNVSYFAKDKDINKVIESCKKARSDDFIVRLPYGYDTRVNAYEGLSQGERQMIAISRMMMKDPSLMILDEATSNIDTRNEKLINDAFDMMMENKTSLVIAHRLSTIKKADKIIMIDKGQIKEIGSHVSLMKQKSYYYNLYMSQFK